MDWSTSSRGVNHKIFDAHLHLGARSNEPLGVPPFIGGLAISRSADDNKLYVQAASELGLNCAVFIGPSELDRKQAIQWIADGSACAYDHIELLDDFAPTKFRWVCNASVQGGKPLVVHLSHHDRRHTNPTLVSACLEYVTDNFPGLNVIIAHLAGENFSTAVAFARYNPNLFFDISKLAETAERLGMALPRDLLKRLRAALPSTRILFGTDQVAPWNPKWSVEYSAVCEAFSEAEATQVLATNALSLLGQC